MVTHIVLWVFKSELSPEQKREAALKIKEGLEGLNGRIEGLAGCTVAAAPIPSSDADAALISVFESESALEYYQEHPLHLEVKKYVASVAQSRRCIDFQGSIKELL